jgi:general secretion pathway protein K
MVMALATLLATRLMAAQDSFLGGVQTERDIRQARLLAQAGVDWGRAVLLEDMTANSVDHLGEAWARQVPAIDAEGGQMGGYLRDALSCFNINNLVDESNAIDRDMLMAYMRLLDRVGVDAALGPRLAEWMVRGGGGAQGARMPAVPRAYFALADLAQVAGYTPEVRGRLRPYLAALPQRTAINVNTADAVVLAAAADLSPDEAARAVAQRQTSWFRDSTDFANRSNSRLAARRLWTTQSNYFLAHVTAVFGDARVITTALLRRQPGLDRVEVAAMQYGNE